MMLIRYLCVVATLVALTAACDDTAPGSVDSGTADLAIDLELADGARHSDSGDGQDGLVSDALAPVTSLLGVYEVSGSDPSWGSYHGQAEVRQADDGRTLVYHVQTYDKAEFEGDRVALAWQGEVHTAREPYLVTFLLERLGFITSYGEESRESVDPEPLVYRAELSSSAPKVLSGTFVDPKAMAPSLSETWTWTGPGGAEPIWQNLRQAIPGHAPLSADQEQLIATTFTNYHERENIQPYVSRPEFQEGIHYWIFDPTDFDFYQEPANRDVLRVIQKVVDPISLAEARLRNRAYRQPLAEKAAYYEAAVPQYNLVGPAYQGDPGKPSGVVSFFFPDRPAGQQVSPDGDAMEWTGDYVTSQSYRYRLTGDPQALENLLRGLRGIFVCYEIAPTPGDFARTIRPHQANPQPPWHQGAPPYESYDWLEGANNDMIKGFLHGFTAAYFALEQAGGYEEVIARMVAITNELLDHSALAADWQGNEALLRLFLFMADNDLEAKLKYELIYAYLKLWMVDWGNGSTYEMGLSDWSGNYMNVKSLIHFLEMEQHLQATGRPMSHIAEYQAALKIALEHMRHTRLGFYQLATASLGAFATPPPELEDARWVLREFPAPKVLHNIDWRINPDFCLSPVPNLPWKMDWADPEHDRSHSLTVYPLFERRPSNIQWKEMPGDYRGSAANVIYSGVDYLHAYWLGRYYGVIDPSL